MDGYTALNAEITSIRSFALLNLLELDCADLNKEMSNRCLSLRNSLILWQVSAQKACLGLGAYDRGGVRASHLAVQGSNLGSTLMGFLFSTLLVDSTERSNPSSA